MAGAEYYIQVELVNKIISNYPDIDFRSDLGGIRLTKGLAIQAKRLQKGRGWPDLFIAEPRLTSTNKVFMGMFIEIKDEGVDLFQKRDRTKWANEHVKEQAETLSRLRAKGYYAEFGIGFEDCWRQVQNYLSLPTVNPKAEVILEFIKRFISENNYSPSQEEIQAETSLTMYQVKKSLGILEAQGFIIREYSALRSIKLP